MKKIYGYCGISTALQSIERQERNIIKAYPTAEIIKETFTGTKTDRPRFNSLLQRVKPGDTIVFDSVSRMSRNATEGIELYMQLKNNDINLVFLKEPYINTTTYSKALNNQIEMTGNIIADEYIKATNRVLEILAQEQIKQAFEQSQKEVDDLHQRTKEGMETARLNGKQIGARKGQKNTVKKCKPALEVIKKHSARFNGTLNDKDTAKLASISRPTLYKYIQLIESEGK